MAKLIYVVEDEDNIREIITLSLKSSLFEVESFVSAELMFSMCDVRRPDLIILDIMLPGMDGIAALEKLKSASATKKIPVIMLTAKAEEINKVKGLDSGADDYITKPFGVLELMARVRACFRRNSDNKDVVSALVFKDIVVNIEKHSVKIDGKKIELTLKEYNLLCELIKNRERVVKRDELLDNVWGYNFEGESRTLDMHIKSLRQKINDSASSPKYIKTVRGVGYTLYD